MIVRITRTNHAAIALGGMTLWTSVGSGVQEAEAPGTGVRRLVRALTQAVAERDRRADEARRLAAAMHDVAGLLGAVAAGVHHVRELMEDEPGLSAEGRAAVALELGALDEVLAHVRALHAQARGERPQAGRPQRLVDLVDGVLAVLGADLSAGVRLASSCPTDVYTPADALDVWRILTNLVRNAVQAMADAALGGRVVVTVDAFDAEVVVRVADEGPGVPERLADRIFERRFTSRADRGGQGLGLAHSRELAFQCGGSLSLERRPGRGATFALRLPRCLADGSEPPAPLHPVLVDLRPAR